MAIHSRIYKKKFTGSRVFPGKVGTYQENGAPRCRAISPPTVAPAGNRVAITAKNGRSIN